MGKKWATTRQNQQNSPSLIRVFAVRMKKAWVLSYPLSTKRRLIRLGGCPGWSESSLGAQPFYWLCIASWLKWKLNKRHHTQRVASKVNSSFPARWLPRINKNIISKHRSRQIIVMDHNRRTASDRSVTDYWRWADLNRFYEYSKMS